MTDRLISTKDLAFTDLEIVMCDGDYKKALIMLLNKINNAPTKEHVDTMTNQRIDEALSTAIEALKAESIKHGRWIYYYDNGVKRCKCSECLTSYGCIDTPFCPNCGVDMRGEE